MACFTKSQQRNGTNCKCEKYVATSNFFVLNSLTKSHLNSVCTEYVCDKSESARVCAKWQWNALDWCYWIALPASPVVQSSNTVSCVSLSFRTHPCVLAIVLSVVHIILGPQDFSATVKGSGTCIRVTTVLSVRGFSYWNREPLVTAVLKYNLNLDCKISNYSNIRRTKFQPLNYSRFILQLSLPNPLKPGVKLRMKL